MASDWISDLAFVVANATPQELQKHQGDTVMKKHRKGQPIGVQGRILDAMDDGHIEPVEAGRLLLEVQRRMFGKESENGR